MVLVKMRVGVLGAAGRMGQQVCRAVAADPELELVGAVDPGAAGRKLGELAGPDVPDLDVHGDLESLLATGAEVAVDFTVAEAAMANMAWCARHGVHCVVGTSGIPDEKMTELARAFDESRANCVLAANFAIGAVLMMRFAEIAAPLFDGAEILELHHDGKVDAPSGTSLVSASRMAQARQRAGLDPFPPDRTSTHSVAGARGADPVGGIRIHSVRIPGLVAHQEVLLGALGQSLTIRHDSYDRSSFMPGVLKAVKAVPKLRGLTVGLEEVLGL